MNWLQVLLILPLFLSTTIAGGLALYSIRRRQAPGAVHFAMLMLAFGTWTFAYAMKLSSQASFGGLNLLQVTYGPVFWASIIYMCILVTIASLILFRALWRGERSSRLRTIAVLAGTALMMLANTSSVFTSQAISLPDWMPFTFLLLEGLFIWSIIHFRFLEILPLAEHIIIDRIDDAILVLDLKWRVIYANQAACALLKLTAKELAGQSASPWIAGWLKKSSPSSPNATGNTKKDFTQREIQLGSGRDQRWYDLRISPLEDPDGLPIGHLVIWHDITRSKQAETGLRERYMLIDSITQQMPFILWSTDTQLRFTSSQGAGLAVLDLKPNQIVGLTLNDGLQHEAASQLILDAHSQALLGTATSSEIPFGGMNFLAFIEPLRNSSSEIIGTIGIALDTTSRKKTEDALHRQLNELTVLHAVATACVEATSEDALIENATRAIGEAFYPDNFGVVLADEKAGLIVKHPSYRERVHTNITTAPLNTGITGRVIGEGKIYCVANVDKFQDYYCMDPETRSELCVPLRVGERIIGAINTESTRLNAFGQDDERLLGTLAGQISIAIERVRAEAAERQRIQELLAISRISHEINSLLDLQRVLDSIARYAVEMSSADASGIIVQQADDQFRLVSAYGVSQQFIDTVQECSIPVHKSAFGQVMVERRPLGYSISDQPHGQPYFEAARKENILSVLVVPMLLGEEFIGGIEIWHRQPHQFSQREEMFLQAIAHQSVSAIQNARLFEAEREQRKLAEVMREAGLVLNTTLEMNCLLDILLEQVARLVPYDAANFMVLEDHRIRVVRSCGYEQFDPVFASQVQSLTLPLANAYNLRQMYETHQPLVVPDVRSDPRWILIDPAYPVRSWAGAPVLIQGKVVGFFSLDSAAPQHFRPEHAERLAIFAGQASLAIQNARLFEETRRRAAHQEALNRVIAAAVTIPDLPELAGTVLEHCLDALNVEKGSLWLSENFAARGLPPEFFEIGLRYDLLCSDNQPATLVVNDWECIGRDNPVFELKEAVLSCQVRASLAVPILAGGKRIGELFLASPMPKDWPAEEVALVEIIGRQVSSAIERLDLLVKTQQQAQQMQSIMDTVPDGVLLLDAWRKVILANPAVRQFLPLLVPHCPPSRPLPINADGYIEIPPLTHLAGHPLESLLTTGRENLWHEIQTETTPRRTFEVAAHPLSPVSNLGNAHPSITQQLAGWVLVLRDVTRERENLARVQMQERLATVGQLAAGIAHDFNNIMAAMVVYSDMLALEPYLTKAGREQVEIIQKQISRASSLIRQILDFSRQGVIEQVQLDLLPFIKELENFLVRTLPENISFRLNYQKGTYMVKGDPTRLQQALMNLALNARDAMPAGGYLQFALRRQAAGDPPLSPDLPPGEWICVTVQDTGEGIQPEIMPHIFDPFFTTKPAGQGTGLGLAQVYGIVQSHAGCIHVQSEPGQGTVFTICLPALAELPEHPPLESHQTTIPTNGEMILLVEDDQVARNAIETLLKSLGLKVLSAANGIRALQVFDQHYRQKPVSTPVRLVISDVVMPEMGGVELYWALHNRLPDIKMLFITGHPMDIRDRALLQTGQVQWLQKPFAFRDLVTILKTMLNGAL